MQNENINGLNIFENTFLYLAYADNAALFLKDQKSVIELTKTFDIFSTFSGLVSPRDFEILGWCTAGPV